MLLLRFVSVVVAASSWPSALVFSILPSSLLRRWPRVGGSSCPTSPWPHAHKTRGPKAPSGVVITTRAVKAAPHLSDSFARSVLEVLIAPPPHRHSLSAVAIDAMRMVRAVDITGQSTSFFRARYPLPEPYRRKEAWQPCNRMCAYLVGAGTRYAVCGTRDGGVLFINTSKKVASEKGEETRPEYELRHPQCLRPVTAVAVHPGGRFVVAGMSKNVVAVWRLR